MFTGAKSRLRCLTTLTRNQTRKFVMMYALSEAAVNGLLYSLDEDQRSFLFKHSTTASFFYVYYIIEIVHMLIHCTFPWKGAEEMLYHSFTISGIILLALVFPEGRHMLCTRMRGCIVLVFTNARATLRARRLNQTFGFWCNMSLACFTFLLTRIVIIPEFYVALYKTDISSENAAILKVVIALCCIIIDHMNLMWFAELCYHWFLLTRTLGTRAISLAQDIALNKALQS